MSQWEMVRLEDVTYEKIEIISKKDSGTIQYIDISAVDNILKKITVINEIPIADAPSRAKQKISYNDILVSTVRPNLNAVAMNLEESNIQRVASTGYCVLRCKKTINPLYLFSFCKSTTFINQLIKVAKGASYPAVSDKDVKNIQIPLPPLEKQQEIAHELDEITEIIALRKEQIKKLDLLVKAKFVEMFGDLVIDQNKWSMSSLGNESELITKGSSPNWQGFDYQETGILFVTSENVRNGFLQFIKKKYLPETFNEQQKRSILQKGDFLINIVGASIGRAAIFNLDEPANINQAVALVRCTTINSVYLITYLNSERAKRFYLKEQSESARANLSLKNISDIPVPLPPLPLQEQFAHYVQAVEETKQDMEEGLAKMEMLYQERMQKWFG